MDFTEEQEALVRKSWMALKRDNPEYCVLFFTKILELAPPVREMFSFLMDSDENLRNNFKVKEHAHLVFQWTCISATQLHKKGEVVLSNKSRQYLGSIHLKKGVLDSHFEVVKEALLATLKEGVGEKWSVEMEEAWSIAYSKMAATIKAEIEKQQEANQNKLANVQI